MAFFLGFSLVGKMLKVGVLSILVFKWGIFSVLGFDGIGSVLIYQEVSPDSYRHLSSHGQGASRAVEV